MKQIKKVISIVLVTLMLFCLFAPYASAYQRLTETDEEYRASSLYYLSDFVRYEGTNRYDTSINAAEAFSRAQGFSNPVYDDQVYDKIIIAYGKNYADALSGTYLSCVAKAPILLVDSIGTSKSSKNSVTSIFEFVCNKIKPDGLVYILGGESAVSNEFQNSIENVGITTKRLAGKNRFDTNMKILEECLIYEPYPSEVLICDGKNFADALSASALGKPIVLIDKTKGSFPSDKGDYINRVNPFDVTIIGGESAVPTLFEAWLANNTSSNIDRVSGSNRYSTSCEIAKKYFSESKNAVVVCGHDFPDGLCAGPIANGVNAPVLLVDDNKLSYARDYVHSRVKRFAILGGTASVSSYAESQLKSSKKEYTNLDAANVVTFQDYPLTLKYTDKTGRSAEIVITSVEDVALYNISTSSVYIETWVYYTVVKNQSGDVFLYTNYQMLGESTYHDSFGRITKTSGSGGICITTYGLPYPKNSFTSYDLTLTLGEGKEK